MVLIKDYISSKNGRARVMDLPSPNLDLQISASTSSSKVDNVYDKHQPRRYRGFGCCRSDATANMYFDVACLTTENIAIK